MRSAAASLLLLLAFPAFPATFNAGEVVSVSQYIIPCVIDPPPPPSSVAILHDRNAAIRRNVTTQAIAALTSSPRGLIAVRWTGYTTESIEFLGADGNFVPFPIPLDLRANHWVKELTPLGDGFVALVANFADRNHQEFWRIDDRGQVVDQMLAPVGQYSEHPTPRRRAVR